MAGEEEMEELIIKARRGDTDAYTQIILNIRNDLYKIAKTRIINEDDIDDAIQETMIQSYKSIKKLRDPLKFRSWIITILINNCNKIYRKRQKLKEIDQEYDLEVYHQDNRNNGNDLMKLENLLDFYTLLGELRYEERIIIVLHYQERFTIKEISHILKTKEDTIKTRLARAKKKIKSTYKGGIEIG